ncbi:MAG TPA: zinc-binding dehydrogenase [Catenuloplanes sp.]
MNAPAPDTMTAARLYGVADLRTTTEPRPIPGPGESLVRVSAVGLCGSDLHWYTEAGIGDARLAEPLVIGHEFAGVVVDGPRAGQRVAVDPAIACERCETCRRGWGNLCPRVRFAGHGGLDGGLREFLAWPTDLLHPLPDALSDADGAMLEPLGVALHAVDLGHQRLGGTVAVVGCGPIGLLTIALARLAGAARVIAADRLPHRVDAARDYGADEVVHAGEPGADEHWRAAVGPGVDVAYEVGGNDEAVEGALDAARPGGRVVLVGIPDDDRISFRASVARRKGLTIALSRRMNVVYPRAIELVRSGRVEVRSLVTHRYPLRRAGEAFETAVARQGLKVLIEPGA